jgi:hypothetical protein
MSYKFTIHSSFWFTFIQSGFLKEKFEFETENI